VHPAVFQGGVVVDEKLVVVLAPLEVAAEADADEDDVSLRVDRVLFDDLVLAAPGGVDLCERDVVSAVSVSTLPVCAWTTINSNFWTFPTSTVG
jgi:hypothetical protein